MLAAMTHPSSSSPIYTYMSLLMRQEKMYILYIYIYIFSNCNVIENGCIDNNIIEVSVGTK